MRTAILFEPSAASARPDARAVVDRVRTDLERQLASLGYAPVVIGLGRPVVDLLVDLEAALPVTGEVLLVEGRLVAHTSALRALAGDPRVTRGLLVGAGGPQQPGRAVQVDRGVVVGMSSPLHEPLAAQGATLGVCRLDAGTATIVPDLVRRCRDRLGDARVAAAFDEDPVATLAALLLDDGVRLSAVDVRGLVARRVADPRSAATARAERDAGDEDRVWLDAAVKARDGFFTTFLVSPYTRFWARWAARRGLTPNQVTAASMATGVLAALFFAAGSRWWVVLGALTLQLSFSLDCVDGQLSRYTQRFTTFGGWLDATFDRAKETLVYAGLAVWGTRIGDPAVWGLATVALGFQMVRHTVDFSFSSQRPPPEPRRPRLRDAAPPADDDHGPGRVLAAAGAAEDHPLLRWAKRIIVLPIGERFAVISVTAIVSTPRVTFLILLGWGMVAFAYTLVGRLLRTRAWAEGRWRWLSEPAVRAAEYGSVVVVGVLLADAAPAAYAALAALVTRHYDEVYRTKALGPASLDTVAARVLLPWWGRTGIVLAAGVSGVVEPVLWAVAGVVGVVTVVDAVLAWRRAGTAGAFASGVADDEVDA